MDLNQKIDNANVPPVFPGLDLPDLPDVQDYDDDSDENDNNGDQASVLSNWQPVSASPKLKPKP